MKYLLRNRHTLLAGIITAFLALVLLEASLSEREVFRFEIDNSFLHIRVSDPSLLDDLEILDDIDIDIDIDFP